MKNQMLLAAALLDNLAQHPVLMILMVLLLGSLALLFYVILKGGPQKGRDQDLQDQVDYYRGQMVEAYAKIEEQKDMIAALQSRIISLLEAQKSPGPVSPEVPKETLQKQKPQFFEFPVKGVFNHEEDIFHKLMVRNPNYDYTKAELIEYEVPGYPIYKWVPKALPAMLVPEPDNLYDSNAIRVEIGDVLIGYVPKGECRKVLGWIRDSKIDNIAFQITGGAYKLLDEDYDVTKDKSNYTLETGRGELAAKVTLRVLE